MKKIIWILACWIAAGGAFATETKQPVICEGFRDVGSPQQSIAAIREPIETAIYSLDNVRVETPSPVIATGKLTYLKVSSEFPSDLDKIRVFGYFELKDYGRCAIPLVVSHIERVQESLTEPGSERTRIYFRMPDIDWLGSPFGHMYQQVNLYIAVYGKGEGEEGEKIYFGRKLKLVVSHKHGSVGLALIFAAIVYVIAAAAVAAIVSRETGVTGTGWRHAFKRLMPWNIIGDSGQTALSQLQMLMFTLIVATLLFYQWLRTGLLQELSTDLLYLIGISTAGAAGSQVTAKFKKGLAPKVYEYVQQLGWFNAPFARPQGQANPAELLMTNKRFDTNKFQMMIFTFVIAAYVIASGASELDTLRISATLLTLMGMSQGAYVGGHATSDSLATLQHQLRGMQTIQKRYQGSTDEQVKQDLLQRFEQAATRAAAMFGNIYGREITGQLLEMPIDVEIASEEEAPQAA
jgi:hypothetical protein